MKLRVKLPEVVSKKQTNAEEKSSHVKVNGRKKHVQNQGTLISLPVEKVMEKKTQKGKPNSKRRMKINR